MSTLSGIESHDESITAQINPIVYIKGSITSKYILQNIPFLLMSIIEETTKQIHSKIIIDEPIKELIKRKKISEIKIKILQTIATSSIFHLEERGIPTEYAMISYYDLSENSDEEPQLYVEIKVKLNNTHLIKVWMELIDILVNELGHETLEEIDIYLTNK